jgi:hypothetical protein
MRLLRPALHCLAAALFAAFPAFAQPITGSAGGGAPGGRPAAARIGLTVDAAFTGRVDFTAVGAAAGDMAVTQTGAKLSLPLYDQDPVLNDAFGGFYRHSGPSEHMYHATMKLISLQSFLQVKKIPYLFVFGRQFKILERYSHLRKLVDWDQCYTDHTILDLMEQRDSRDPDGLHPSADVYIEFANLILPRIQQLV